MGDDEQDKPKKDSRLNFTIGAFNDGLKSHFSVKRLLSDKDVTTFGIARS